MSEVEVAIDDDYETIPNGSVYANLMAGALAGITEHTVMYPFDAIKVGSVLSLIVPLCSRLPKPTSHLDLSILSRHPHLLHTDSLRVKYPSFYKVSTEC
jgi:hypothetical protein